MSRSGAPFGAAGAGDAGDATGVGRGDGPGAARRQDSPGRVTREEFARQLSRILTPTFLPEDGCDIRFTLSPDGRRVMARVIDLEVRRAGL